MSNDVPLSFGLAVPVFASPGIAGMRTPSFEKLEWGPVRESVIRAEQLGYDSAWFSDHLFHGRDGEFFESWTALSVLAGSTDRIRLVNNHLCNNFRHAPMLAKMAATLDVASDGRFDLFLSPGMREREHTSYGFDWEPDPVVRTRKLTEAVRMIRATWSGLPTNFDGEFYRVHDLINMPTPVQPDGPPVWVGGILNESTLDLIATQADGWNSFPASLDMFETLVGQVDQACMDHNRNPESLKKSLETQVLVLDDPSDWDLWMDRWDEMRRRSPPGVAVSDMVGLSEPFVDRETLTAHCHEKFIIGTREEVTEKLRAYQQLGVTDFVCWFMDFPDDSSMRALATDIRPLL